MGLVEGQPGAQYAAQVQSRRRTAGLDSSKFYLKTFRSAWLRILRTNVTALDETQIDRKDDALIWPP